MEEGCVVRYSESGNFFYGYISRYFEMTGEYQVQWLSGLMSREREGSEEVNCLEVLDKVLGGSDRLERFYELQHAVREGLVVQWKNLKRC